MLPNIIFLDIDGVLNNIPYAKKYREESGKVIMVLPFDPACLARLKKIVEMTDAKIVVSSCCRNDDGDMMRLEETLQEIGIGNRIIGKTPYIKNDREVEIKKFLADLGYSCNFFIIDDCPTMGELTPYIVKTSGIHEEGLTDENVVEAVTKLGFKHEDIKSERKTK